jgi:phage shock protein PspC (stress-responsive transcriptional regulator)
MTSPTPGSQLDAMRRTTGDKLLGGVSGGIARSLDIDPVIVRIGFVVLTVAGFAGPILYLACWLLIPAEGSERSVLSEVFDIQADSQLRTVGLIIAGVIAVAAVLGDTAWGVGGWFWWPLWIMAWLAVPFLALYWLLVVRPRQSRRPRFTPPPPYQPPHDDLPPAATTGDTAMTETLTDPEATTVLDEPGPPPRPPASAVLPPRPKREPWSPALLVVTLSTILVAMGALALWSVSQDPLDPGVYPAVALAIVAAGLLVGTRIGHPGALIPVGLLVLPVLALASFVPNLEAGVIDVRPATAASIAEPIEQGFGEVQVDLTSIRDPESLTGRTLEISNGLGETTVIVPDGLDVDVDASLSVGGRIEVFGKVVDGSDPAIDEPSDAPGAYRIVITGTAGEISVVRA